MEVTTMKKSLLVALMILVFTAMIVSAVAARANGALRASATLVDPAGNVVGEAKFTEDAAGNLHVNVEVKGISPGLHGIHLHAVGSCTPDFAAAGGHHNPLGHQHGLDNPLGAHGGDLPNLVVNGAGNGHLNATSDRATLSPGPTTLFDADGSSVIIHADEDDQVTDPTGNSGGRIACGVITLN
jgi:superoxide dismutase, Cu-Zn family